MLKMLKAGKKQGQFEVVPVREMLDEVVSASAKSPELGVDRYQLLDIDDYWLVVHEWITATKAHQEYICFKTADDAYTYLEMCGIEDKRPKEKNLYDKDN